MNVIELLPDYIRNDAKRADRQGLEEIRMRLGQPVEYRVGDGRVFWGIEIDRKCLEEVMNFLTDYSRYTIQEQLKNGFFTVEGGHRVGVAGRCNYQGKGNDSWLCNMTEISAINIRVAHERIGCAKEIMRYIRCRDSIYNSLIVSEPGVGKTTYIRDCIRIISGGADGRKSMRVGLVDERSEIGASYRGKPQNNLGPRTDVMDNCPKLIGMKMLLRSMSPQVIAIDELDGEKECEEVKEIVNSGVRLLCSVHAASFEELENKEFLWKLIEKGIFQRIIFLERLENGVRNAYVYNEKREKIC